MEKLKKEYPQHSELLSMMSGQCEMRSFSQFQHLLEEKIESIKGDKSFKEAIAYVIVTAIVEQQSVKDSLLIPMMEYLESGTASKVFLTSPFLCAKVPKGGGVLKCKLRFYDLLKHNCSKPITIRTRLLASDDTLVPLKEIIQVSRENIC